MAMSTNYGEGGGGKSYAKKQPGQYSKGGGKGLQGDALKGNVSATVIKDIKRMGMANALRLAGQNGNTAGGLAREFQEGVRRMYGADRLKAAKAKYAPAKTKSADAARSSVKPVKPVKTTAPKYKSPDSARSAAGKPKYNTADSARRSSTKK